MTTARTGLILDFGGVLTSAVETCTADFERRSGLPAGTLLAFIGRDPVGVALYEDLERGAISQAAWNTAAAAALGLEADGLLGRVLSGLRPCAEMIDAAAAARAAGIRVGIFSNSVGAEPFDLYAGYDLADRYDTVLLSEQHGTRKPDPALYATMLRQMELPGEACVFVDDTPANLPPARELGVAVIHHRDHATTVPELEKLLEVGLRA